MGGIRTSGAQRETERGCRAGIIAQGVSDVFTAANVESLPSASIASWCETWLHAKSIEAEQSTHARYKRIVERFT